MNIFRIGGDLSHLVSFFFLLQTLYKGRSSIGISLKTQELYLLVFITRYLDLFTAWHSLYNTSMKIIYIGISALIVYGIRFVVSGRCADGLWLGKWCPSLPKLCKRIFFMPALLERTVSLCPFLLAPFHVLRY